MDMQPGPEQRMPPMPINPQTVLMAALEAQEWGVAITALRKLPYEAVAVIIAKLSEQLTAAQQATGVPASTPQE